MTGVNPNIQSHAGELRTPLQEVIIAPNHFVIQKMGRIACSKEGVDPDIFFPGPRPSRGSRLVREEYFRKVQEAKEHCGNCESRENCLNYAVSNNENEGIWGGLTEEERKRLGRSPGI